MLVLEILIILLILLLLLGTKVLSRQWCNPANIMALYWSSNILFAFFVLDSYQWQFTGVLWIIIVCTCFMLSLAVSEQVMKKKINRKKIHVDLKMNHNSSNLMFFLWVCLLVGLIRVGLDIAANGLSIQMFFNLGMLTEINNSMAYERYSGNVSYGTAMQIMLGIMYGGALIGGYFFVDALKISERILCISIIIPFFFILLIHNTKLVFMAVVMLWLSGYLTRFLEKYKRAPIIKAGAVCKFILLSISFLSLLYMSMVLRIGAIDTDTLTKVNAKILSYVIAHMPAFDYWFANDAGNTDYTYGKYTFYAIFQTLGISIREQGVFTDFVSTSEFSTNIFTVFRGIIIDFGVFGGIVFFILLGFVVGYAYQCILHKDRNVFASIVLANTYFFIGLSFTVSSWTYSSFLFAFLLFGLCLWSNTHKVKIKLN